MTNIWNSVAFRLALVFGTLVVAAVMLLSTAIYLGTVGVLSRQADEKIAAITERLVQYAESHNAEEAAQKIEQALNDGVDSDTEIYLLADANGKKIAGNIPMWTDKLPAVGPIVDGNVMRDGRASVGRMLLHRLPDHSLLVVGRDMSDLHDINLLIWRAIGIGGLLAIILSVLGTIYFRAQIERKILAIRQAAREIEAGDLSRRIPLPNNDDEFARLGRDLNRMLDRIEHLMEGVRHVSNTIAHNLRTPLGRIRGRLDESLRNKVDQATLAVAGNYAIEEVDRVIVLLDKLLQLAEAESGTRRQSFDPVSFRAVVTDIVELYDAAAEDAGLTLTSEIVGNPDILGDHELLASALANLLDNALKYAGPHASINILANQIGKTVTLIVADNGPGIPEHERVNVLQRFYRLDQETQGSGIGLSIVAAIIALHGGMLALEDAGPGLLVRMTFPRIALES